MIGRKKLYNNESAVSVLVGTLALIAVVIAGTMGIAAIVGSFSTDVSKQASPDQSVAATKTPVYISGSDNMDVLTRSLAESYTAENPSVRIVYGIISPASVYNSINSKITDIGALAGPISYADITKNPDIKTTQIGSSAVVVITNKVNLTSYDNPTYTNLKNFFTSSCGGSPCGPLAGAQAVTRIDSSGTADTFCNNFLGIPSSSTCLGIIQENSDADVISYVASNPNAVGFADYGDVQTAISNNGVPISIISIDDSIRNYPAGSLTYDNVKVAAKYQYLSTQRHADGSPVWTGTQLANVLEYNLSLCYPLYYVTKDKPNTVQQGILDYATSPAARPAFIKANVFSVADF